MCCCGARAGWSIASGCAGCTVKWACNCATNRPSAASRRSCGTIARRRPLPTRSGPWTLFMTSCSNGRKIRILTVVDTFTRLSPAMEVRQQFRGADVVAVLERVFREIGCPKTIRLDNGPEFVSRELDLWAFMCGVTLDFSRPGKPTDNAFIESLNGKFRAECLNANWFLNLDEARRRYEAWRRDYNEVRSHSAIGNQVPAKLHRLAGIPARRLSYEAEFSSPEWSKVGGKSKSATDSGSPWLRLGEHVRSYVVRSLASYPFRPRIICEEIGS